MSQLTPTERHARFLRIGQLLAGAERTRAGDVIGGWQSRLARTLQLTPDYIAKVSRGERPVTTDLERILGAHCGLERIRLQDRSEALEAAKVELLTDVFAPDEELEPDDGPEIGGM